MNYKDYLYKGISDEELMLLAETMFFDRLLTDVCPSGILSYVSDSYNFWGVINYCIPKLKDKIIARDGKVVIRPDSGDPVKILTGHEYKSVETRSQIWQSETVYYIEDENKYFEVNDISEYLSFRPELKFTELQECEVKGLIEVLWDQFGGTLTDKGFKRLDSHIGAIYGDSITLERQKEINDRLIKKGFSPEVVLGVGSYSYQYVTRDTHGSAMKATNVMFGDKSQAIYKEPKTDMSKKSARGLIKVVREDGMYKAIDEQSRESWFADDNCLEVVYLDGKIIKETSLAEIRALVHSQA